MSQKFETTNWKLAQFLFIANGLELTGEIPGTRIMEDIYKDKTVIFQFDRYRDCKELANRWRAAGDTIQRVIEQALRKSP